MENLREQIQQQALEAIWEQEGKAMILVAPRTGKCQISLKSIPLSAKEILIVFPRWDIQEGWDSEIERLGITGVNVTYTTFMSLKNHVNKQYDYFIFDEYHEASDNQLEIADRILQNIPTLFLSGTATQKTLNNIQRITGLSPCFEYSIQQAVKDGILCEYDIYVHTVPLDNKLYQYENKKGKKYTEKMWYDYNQYMANKSPVFFERKLMSVVQNSIAKLNKTRALIRECEGERAIIFCGTTDIADSLGIPSYHSKNKDNELFTQFCEGYIPKCSCVKMLQAGVKIVPIYRAIFNFLSGATEMAAQSVCRVLAKEAWNPGKRARIDIVCSDTKYEKNRLRTALLFFNEDNIHYV